MPSLTVRELLKIGTRVVASCPCHQIKNEPGVVNGHVNKTIYPTGHGEYVILFDSGRCLMCNEEHVVKAVVEEV